MPRIRKILPRIRVPEKSENTQRVIGKPFEPGNPGKPLGARTKISEAFLKEFYAEWQRRGDVALQAIEHIDLVRIAASLLPKQVEVTEEIALYVLRDEPVSSADWAAQYGATTETRVGSAAGTAGSTH